MEKSFRTYFKSIISIVFGCMLLASCIQHQEREIKEAEKEKSVFDSTLQIHYAKGFQVEFKGEAVMLKILDPRNGKVLGEWELVDRNQHQGKWKANQIPVPIQSTVCLSTTHFAYFKKIKEQDKVKGAVNVSYSLDKDLKQAVANGKIEDLTAGGELNQEKVMSMAPELVLVYPFGDQSYQDLVEAQIPVLNITEYLELDPLAKAEWIKLFGLLTGKDSLAKSKFEKIEHEYQALQAKVNHKDSPCVFFNTPFKKTWNLPSGNSYGAKLVGDAGFEYIYQEVKNEGNLTYEVDQVLHDVENCDNWVIVSYFPEGITKNKLEQMIPGIQVTKAFMNDNIYVCNTAEVDYFGEACLQPQRLLKDLIYWKDTSMVSGYQPKYIYQLVE